MKNSMNEFNIGDLVKWKNDDKSIGFVLSKSTIPNCYRIYWICLYLNISNQMINNRVLDCFCLNLILDKT